MVTFCVTKMVTTCLLMFGQFFDTMVQVIKSGYNDPSKYKCQKLFRATLSLILGDPGTTNRDDAIFSGERYFRHESLLQELKSPWDWLFLTKRVPEVVEIRSADWQVKYFFSGQSMKRSSWVILSPSYTKWSSSSMYLVAWPLQREDSREEFQKQKVDEVEEIVNRNMGAKNQSDTLPSILSADLLKAYCKFV